jgi:hypothetical protein
MRDHLARRDIPHAYAAKARLMTILFPPRPSTANAAD